MGIKKYQKLVYSKVAVLITVYLDAFVTPKKKSHRFVFDAGLVHVYNKWVDLEPRGGEVLDQILV